MKTVKGFRSLLVVLFLCFFFNGVHAQQLSVASPYRVYTVAQLTADFNYCRALLEKAHPGLYRYISKDSMDQYFDQALAKLDHPMNEVAFWQILQPVVAQIKCGHTSLLVSDTFLYKYAYGYHPILPFNVYIKGERLFVRRFFDVKDSSLAKDDEVLAINNETADQLLHYIRPLTSGDGYNPGYQNAQLEYGRFGSIYWLTHPGVTGFDITYRSKGILASKHLDALMIGSNDSAVRQKAIDAADGGGWTNELAHKLSYPADLPQTALLTIGSFTYTDYKSYHRKLFKALRKKKIRNLVIDLRFNGGGSNYDAIDLLKYLVKDSFTLTRGNETVIDTSSFSALNYNKKSGNVNPLLILSLIEHKPHQFWHSLDGMQQSYKKTFDGNVYLLTNEGTFSAAALFAVALKLQRDCKIIGQETGGGLAGCDGGVIKDIVLPETSLRLSLPLFWTYSASKAENTGTGLIPDYPVPIIARFDTCYGLLKALLNQQ